MIGHVDVSLSMPTPCNITVSHIGAYASAFPGFHLANRICSDDQLSMLILICTAHRCTVVYMNITIHWSRSGYWSETLEGCFILGGLIGPSS